MIPENPLKRDVIHNGHLCYVVLMWPENSAVVAFRALTVMGVDSKTGEILLKHATEAGYARTPEEADVALEGSLKWDGCMNWKAHEADCLAHHCGLDEWNAFRQLVQVIYEMAAELMPDSAETLLGRSA